ncbi:hypothetical protein GOBAR_DD06534 [Gossypium barbadense]|nr:hypothetical protein GOBAR_DD06534 [Gossypium barbadense]
MENPSPRGKEHCKAITLKSGKQTGEPTTGSTVAPQDTGDVIPSKKVESKELVDVPDKEVPQIFTQMLNVRPSKLSMQSMVSAVKDSHHEVEEIMAVIVGGAMVVVLQWVMGLGPKLRSKHPDRNRGSHSWRGKGDMPLDNEATEDQFNRLKLGCLQELDVLISIRNVFHLCLENHSPNAYRSADLAIGADPSIGLFEEFVVISDAEFLGDCDIIFL